MASARTADDFLVEIAARPDDDGLKTVFADWLLERGDPRGELMALQLKAERSDEELSREALLLRANVRQWLPDEVFINLVPSSIVFEKGVFSAARVQVRSQSALTASLPHPVWAAVRRLSGAPAELIERCHVVEALTEVDDETLLALALKGRAVGRLRVLGVSGVSERVLGETLDAPALATVRELRLAHEPGRFSSPQNLSVIKRTHLAHKLQRLVLHSGWLELSELLLAESQGAPTFRELQLAPMPFSPSNWSILLTRSYRDVELYPGSELNASFSEGQVREILATAPRGWFSGLALPDDVDWRSVVGLPCFVRATVRRIERRART
ncbi:MAG: TIGR02996 domain-containing protein [Myxococcaceae bacterium]|nr:TIGR02996 domain-containing protein [Myxococcaceae bacterium]